jgi:hypothetical protein
MAEQGRFILLLPEQSGMEEPWVIKKTRNIQK